MTAIATTTAAPGTHVEEWAALVGASLPEGYGHDHEEGPGNDPVRPAVRTPTVRGE